MPKCKRNKTHGLAYKLLIATLGIFTLCGAWLGGWSTRAQSKAWDRAAHKWIAINPSQLYCLSGDTASACTVVEAKDGVTVVVPLAPSGGQ